MLGCRTANHQVKDKKQFFEPNLASFQASDPGQCDTEGPLLQEGPKHIGILWVTDFHIFSRATNPHL